MSTISTLWPVAQTPPVPVIDWRVGVVIPARDEEDTIVACLRSVRRSAAVARQLRNAAVDIVVVADRCRDATVRLAERELRGCAGTVMQVEEGCAGAARALGSAAAFGRAFHHPSRWWLANTDADTVVPPHWIARQLALAASGCAAVAGIVDIRPDEPELRERFIATYERRADGSHPHVHGANLGVRGDAYVTVGGWSSLVTGEDHDLWDRIGAAGFSRRSDDRVWVLTSARRTGRAPEGFARNVDQLAVELAAAAD